MSSPVYPPFGFGSGGMPVTVPPSFGGPNGSAPAVNAYTVSLPLPEIVPIPDAHEFNIEGHVATAAVINNANITGATFTVPDNNLAVIRGVTFYVTNMLTTTNILFSLLINDGAPSGYGGVTIFPRVAPFVGNGFESMIRFQGAAVIRCVFSNVDGGTYVVGASFSGWFWPEASDSRWKTYGR